jgi:hypothetical protein
LRNSEPIGIDLVPHVEPGDISPVQIGAPGEEVPLTDQGASEGFRREQKGTVCDATKRLTQSCPDMPVYISVPCISEESWISACLDSVLVLAVSRHPHANIAY